MRAKRGPRNDFQWHVTLQYVTHTTDKLYRTTHDTHNRHFIPYRTQHSQLTYYTVQNTTHTLTHHTVQNTTHTLTHHTVQNTTHTLTHHTVQNTTHTLTHHTVRNTTLITNILYRTEHNTHIDTSYRTEHNTHNRHIPYSTRHILINKSHKQ
jgi:hypothetical protein